MSEKLKISIWNANGLAQRSLELKTFLTQHDIDVILISETHFTSKSYLKIPNYEIYHTNHPENKAHGNSAVIVKKTIKHYENVSHRKNYLQATSFK